MNKISRVLCILILISQISPIFSQNTAQNNNVKIGVITYSWRSMPSSMDDIINYCKETNISSIELMGNILEQDLGLDVDVPRKKGWQNLSKNEKEELEKKISRAQQEVKDWRLSQPMSKFEAVGEKFRSAGIEVHTVKFAPSSWSDEEIDYAFRAAKAIGAKAITNEIGIEACERLPKFAEKYNMYVALHNHTQPGNEGFSFDTYLDYSPRIMLNFDMGHYWGVTDINPAQIVEKYHDRIYSIHLKDKTGKANPEPNQNREWGRGTTPLRDVLALVQAKYPQIYCDIELEYKIPENSDAVNEVGLCVKYAKMLLDD